MTKILTIILTLLVVFVSIAAVCTRAQTPRATSLEVGELAPDFTLADHHGHKTTLSDSRNNSPVVLVFYRGYW